MSVEDQSKRLVGIVKWFNNKAGYGFVTVQDDVEQKGEDIFVHFSSINVADSQYKYLVPGEYVEFVLETSENDEHKYHAQCITGIKGGPIMCETRRLILESQPSKRPERRVQRDVVTELDASKASRNSSKRPVSEGEDNEGFVRVQRRPRTVKSKLVQK